MLNELVLEIALDEKAVYVSKEVLNFGDLQAEFDRDLNSYFVDWKVVLERLIAIEVGRVALAAGSIGRFELVNDSLDRCENQLFHVDFKELLPTVFCIW